MTTQAHSGMYWVSGSTCKAAGNGTEKVVFKKKLIRMALSRVYISAPRPSSHL